MKKYHVIHSDFAKIVRRSDWGRVEAPGDSAAMALDALSLPGVRSARRGCVVVGLALLLGVGGAGCAQGVSKNESRGMRVGEVIASAQTELVSSDGDAADDPAIWVCDEDPTKSLIFGTDKRLGLAVFDLNGRLLQMFEDGRLNNVDLRALEHPQYAAVAAASCRDDQTIRLFAVRKSDRTVVRLGPAIQTGVKDEVYGLCVGRGTSARQAGSGTFDVFVSCKSGPVEWHRVMLADDGVRSTHIETIKFATQTEGLVFDDLADVLYVGEENVGVWRVDLRDAGGSSRGPRPTRLIDRVQPDGSGALTADVEGVTIIRPDSHPDGILLVSSQGDSTFAAYDIADEHRLMGRFRIVGGTTIDEVTHTDGLDAVFAHLGPSYPRGIVVVQDDEHPLGRQNYKIVDWREVEGALGL